LAELYKLPIIFKGSAERGWDGRSGEGHSLEFGRTINCRFQKQNKIEQNKEDSKDDKRRKDLFPL